MKQLFAFITFLSIVALSCTSESSTPKLGIIYPESSNPKHELIYGTEDIGRMVIQDLKNSPQSWAYKNNENPLAGPTAELFENFKGIIVHRYYDVVLKEERSIVTYNNCLVYSFESNSKETVELDSALNKVIVKFKNYQDSVSLEYDRQRERDTKSAQLEVINLLKSKGS